MYVNQIIIKDLHNWGTPNNRLKAQIFVPKKKKILETYNIPAFQTRNFKQIPPIERFFVLNTPLFITLAGGAFYRPYIRYFCLKQRCL